MAKGLCKGRSGEAAGETAQCCHGTHLPTPSLFPHQYNGDHNSNLAKGRGSQPREQLGSVSGFTTLMEFTSISQAQKDSVQV